MQPCTVYRERKLVQRRKEKKHLTGGEKICFYAASAKGARLDWEWCVYRISKLRANLSSNGVMA